MAYKLHEPEQGAFAMIHVDGMLVVQPVLVMESEEAVAEIMQLKTMPIAGTNTTGSCPILVVVLCLKPWLASCTCNAVLVAVVFQQRGCCVDKCQSSFCAILHACSLDSRLPGLLLCQLCLKFADSFHVMAMATAVPFCSPLLKYDPQLNAYWQLSTGSLLAMLVQISACRWWPCGLLQGWMVMSSAAATPDHAIFCTKRPLLPGILLTKHWTSGVEADVVLRDMGRVFDYSNRKQAAGGADREPEMEQGSIAVTAKRLLSFACQVGWSAVSELLLPVASAMDGTASELVAELEDLADEGLTLLHQAVRSRNVDLVSSWYYLRRLTVLLRS